MSMIGDQRWSNDFSRGSAHEQIHHGDAKSSAEFTSTKDSYQKDVFSVHYDAFAPWFCSGTTHVISPSNLLFGSIVNCTTYCGTAPLLLKRQNHIRRVTRSRPHHGLLCAEKPLHRDLHSFYCSLQPILPTE